MKLAPLTADQIETFQKQAYLHLTGWLSDEQTRCLQSWVDDLYAWPETPFKWMKYFEHGQNSARQLCRIEHFLEYHNGLNELVRGQATLDMLGQLMGEPATLFKEKINFKLPGGAGFTAHQDAPAFSYFGPEYHITMMVSVDQSNRENGGLEFSPRLEAGHLLPQSADGSIEPSVAATLEWFPLPTQAGDIVLFDSYIPHRSPKNRSSESRRVLYLTYNRRSDGMVRNSYYERKRAAFPPDCERVEGVDYSLTAGQFNVGNPIK